MMVNTHTRRAALVKVAFISDVLFCAFPAGAAMSAPK
jgi:hypothetical protein